MEERGASRSSAVRDRHQPWLRPVGNRTPRSLGRSRARRLHALVRPRRRARRVLYADRRGVPASPRGSRLVRGMPSGRGPRVQPSQRYAHRQVAQRQRPDADERSHSDAGARAVETTIEDGETLAPGASINQVSLRSIPACFRSKDGRHARSPRFATPTARHDRTPVLGANADIRVAQTRGSPVRIERCFTNQGGRLSERGRLRLDPIRERRAGCRDAGCILLVVAGERVMR